MEKGKALELFIKRLLINVGFTEVLSDGLYLFEGAAGQMIQGLGGAHNADVLLEPPVQTPFYTPTRLLIECKDYENRIGLPTVRSVFGLREDINHFEAIDKNELYNRQRQNRQPISTANYRYAYQVALAAVNGYTKPAQLFAAVHRIPLLEFRTLPFWGDLSQMIHNPQSTEELVMEFADEIGQHMAAAVLNSGQLLFLYQLEGECIDFLDYYSLHWATPTDPWLLSSGNCKYCFHLPTEILRAWIKGASNDLELKREAVNCKESVFSSMVVYYRNNLQPMIKMISIDEIELYKAKRKLEMLEQ